MKKKNGKAHPKRSPKAPLKVVCISDTHGAEMRLPTGDLLLHAGDLTEKGTFDQLQKALNWLSRQPHEHKVIIGGNHDGLLDSKFVKNYPNQYPGETRGPADLDWGSLIYLKDSSTKVKFKNGRAIRIFGSPWICGSRGFGITREEDFWKGKIPRGTDILLTHGPPHGYLDITERGHQGSKSLIKELKRVRPKLVVFGHIHEGYGQETVAFEHDVAKRKNDYKGPGMLRSLFGMFLSSKKEFVPKRKLVRTKLVNAAVPKPGSRGTREGQPRNKPIVTEI